MITTLAAMAFLGVLLIYIPIAQRTYFPLFSPLMVHLSWGLITIAFAYYYNFTFDEKYNLLGVDDIDWQAFVTPLKYYFIAYSSLIAGYISFYLPLSKSSQLAFRHPFYLRINLAQLRVRTGYLMPSVVLLIFIVATVFYIYGYGVLQRETYLLDDSSSMQTILMLECFLFIASNSLLSDKRRRFAGALGLLFYIIVITTGSRRVFLYLLFNFAVLLFIRKRKISWILSWAILLVVFLGYLLTLRSQNSHGLIPYVFEYSFSISDILDRIIYSAYYMLAYSYFVTANVLHVFSDYFDPQYIIIALNPLPGIWAGWYDIAPDLRLNIFAPFNTFGEIFTAGAGITIAYFYTLGIIYCYIELSVRRHLHQNKMILGILIYALLMFSIVLEHQYNLRASTRFVYYSLALTIFAATIKILKSKIMKATNRLEPNWPQ